MSAQRLPSLHTGVGIAGHAHLSPVVGSVPSDDSEFQYVESLLANVVFDVELCGLALHSNASPHEMHYPRLRRSGSKQQVVDHLDVISCWKGLSNAQALELTLWERLFQRCLALQVENYLRRSIVAQLSQVRDNIEEDKLLPLLLQFLPSEQNRLVEVDLPNLIHDMIDAFYDDHPSQTAARNFRWSLGSGDLPGFVYNYITTEDCFLRTPEGLYLCADLSVDCCTMPVLTILANVAWQPPDVRFRPTPSQLRPRGQYIIAPYREPIFRGSDSSSYKLFPDHVEYTVMRSSSMIQWDSVGEVFRAQAPDSPTASETLVQASMVRQFPNNVRFERISRYVVKIEIVDTLQVDAMSDTYKPQAERASMASTPPYTSRSQSETPSILSSRRDSDLHFLEVLRNRRRDSPKKRKASLRSTSYEGSSPVELVHNEADSCLKRQKLEPPRGTDMNDAVVEEPKQSTAAEECKAMLEALDTFRQSVESRSSDKRRCSELLRRLHEAISPVFELVHATIDQDLSGLEDDDGNTLVKENEVPPLSEPPFARPPTPPHSAMESDSSYVSASNSASNSSDLDSKKSIVGASSSYSFHSDELSQAEIQKNYREFEEVAKRRKTDPDTASSCDVGDMNFERIFLEDSEASDAFDEGTSGMSDEMEGLLLDESSV